MPGRGRFLSARRRVRERSIARVRTLVPHDPVCRGELLILDSWVQNSEAMGTMGRPRLFDLDAAVSSALDLFWKRGYAAATPAALLDAIGIGKGSFYNAFEGKHALFERVLRRYGDDRVAGLARSMSGTGPIRQRVKRYVERLAAPESAALLRRGCLAANTAGELGGHDPMATKVVRDTFRRMERVLETAFTEAQQRGELNRSLDAKALAALLLAALIGITVIARVDDTAPLARRIAQAFAALLPAT